MKKRTAHLNYSYKTEMCSHGVLARWSSGAWCLRILLIAVCLLLSTIAKAQVPVDLSDFNRKGEARISEKEEVLDVRWPAGEDRQGRLLIDLRQDNPLFRSVQMGNNNNYREIASDLDPVFILTVGKRNLERNGWTVFFDYPAYRPYESHTITLAKEHAKVVSEGSRTHISIGEAGAGPFSGNIRLTLFNGSPLLKIAAVMATGQDSAAIIYDAGLTSKGTTIWEEIFWSDPQGYIQAVEADSPSAGKNIAVKYRTIIGESQGGSVAVFPAPHQYFYPLDNAYNLSHTWYGRGYRGMIPEYGIGIRHDLMGDRRHVPWFNAPPDTEQQLSFFCVLSTEKDGYVLEEVKRFTNGDSYKPLPGYKTMASHFHTEHINDVLTHKPLPDIPGHVKVMKDMGVNIMHQGEFHLAGNPRDSGPRRLPELQLMYEEFDRLSRGNFLMLPGEEPNVHFGGHWMSLFPKPVYWIMSREPEQPFVEQHPEYGKVYRVGSQEDMLRLLETEDGLAWTAHPRIKGSIGYPDQYKGEKFYHSDHFLGAAWKAMPADLSRPELGGRVLDLMDDMANWGQKKHIIAEADLFKLEPDYEVYGPMNVNYLQLDKLPDFENGWSSVVEVMQAGKFFSTTGEVLLPKFTVNGKGPGETVKLNKKGEADINLKIHWTFPLNYAEIISGDGEQVYREIVPLKETKAFGEKNFSYSVSLRNRTWVRVEVWDVAANGAFTQFVWLE